MGEWWTADNPVFAPLLESPPTTTIEAGLQRTTRQLLDLARHLERERDEARQRAERAEDALRDVQKRHICLGDGKSPAGDTGARCDVCLVIEAALAADQPAEAGGAVG